MILVNNPFQEEIITIGKELEVACMKRITESQTTLIFVHGYIVTLKFGMPLFLILECQEFSWHS